jgi:hypothetical protein
MKFINKLSMKAKASIAFIITQILFKIIFEFKGSKLFPAIVKAKFGFYPPMSPFVVIVIFAIIWGIILLLCIANLKAGYLFAAVFGIFNLFPLVLLLLGIAPYKYNPYFNGWITLCLIYFSFGSYKRLKKSR